MTPCTLRRAGPADAPALAVFGERTFREAFGPANTQSNTDGYVQRTYGPAIQAAELADPAIHTIVAVDAEGALCGYAQVRLEVRAPEEVPGRACELWRFYVDQPWQGQGLAARLMAAVRGVASGGGYDAVWLAVWEHNPRARAFYTREGFRLVGSQPFQLGDDLQTDLVMYAGVTASTSELAWQRLDPRYPAMARQLAWIRVAAWGGSLLLLLFGIWWLTPRGPTALMILGACWLLPMTLLAVLWFWLPVLRYRHASWRLERESLALRTGAWWRSETRVPRSRIQHTDVAQGPLERRHGLGSLVVYTAGTHHSQVTLRGIAHEDAIAIRDQLLAPDRHVPV